MPKTQTTTRLVITTGLVILVVAAGCRGGRSRNRPHQFLPDMDDSPKFKPQTQTQFFSDGRVMRRPVAGTVAFGESARNEEGRAEFLKEDAAFYLGKDGAGQYLEKLPASVKVDRRMLERGQERFNIFCSACHGYQGDGHGTVGEQWYMYPANFHDPKFKDPKTDQGRDGYIFHTIRNGLPDPNGNLKMPAYGYSINEKDAWAIVAYVRALQASRAGTIDDLPPDQRGVLQGTRAAEMEKQRKAAEDAAKAAGAAAGGATPAAAPTEKKP